MAEFGEHLEIDVEDHGLAEAAAEARELADALKGARDAAAELAGADAGDMAGLEAAKEGAAGLRDDLAEAAAAADGLAGSLAAVDGELADADLAQAADDAEEAAGSFGGLGEALSGLAGPAIVAGIGALVVGAAAVAPAAVAATLGIGSFAALAVPSIMKVKTAYTNLTGAQSAYRAARELEAQDPNKSNRAAEVKALAQLQIARQAFGKLPADEQAAVKGVLSLKDAFEQLANSSGIRKDAFGDITKVLGIARSLLPDVGELAKAAAPAIGKMLDAIGRGVKSKGFQDFVKSMSTEIGPAATALTHLGGALLGFTGSTLEKLKPISVPFINSLTHLTKAVTPGLGTLLKNAATGLTKIVNFSAAHVSNLQAVTRDMGKLATLQFKNLSGIGPAFSGLATGLAPLAKILGGINKVSSGGSFIDKLLRGSFSNAVNTMIPGIGALKTLSDAGKNYAKASAAAAQAASNKVAADVNAATGVHPVKIPVKLDTGSISGAYADFAKTLEGHPVAVKFKPVTASDMAAVMGGPGGAGGSGGPKVKATAEVDKVDASHIKSAATNVKIHGATVDLSNAKLSGLSALSGTLGTAGKAAGKAFSTGLASAIQSGGAAATGDARAIAQGVRAAISGLGAAGRSAGEALGQGMAAGIAASTGAAVAAAHAMAGAVEAAAKVSLGIHSPSKVFEKIGQDTVKGLVLGLEGGKSQVAAAMALITGHKAFTDSTITETVKKLTEKVTKAYKDKQISKGEDSQLTGFIRSDNRRLMALAKQRADIEKEIKAADALAKSVAASARQGGSIATLQGAAPGGAVTAGGLEEGMVTQLANIKKFKQELKQLKKEGASKSVLRQVAAEGVTQGGAAAQALLAGGKGAIAKISQLQHQIAQAAKGLGKTAANASYESGSQIGKGLAAGLKGELKGIVAAMKDLARKLVDEIKKALKIHSPSGVMIEVGSMIPAGLVVGIRQGTPAAVGAMHGLSNAVMRPATSYGHASAHPTSVAPMVHVHVHLDGRQVAQSVQSSSLQRGRRNVAVGLKPANRGA